MCAGQTNKQCSIHPAASAAARVPALVVISFRPYVIRPHYYDIINRPPPASCAGTSSSSSYCHSHHHCHHCIYKIHINQRIFANLLTWELIPHVSACIHMLVKECNKAACSQHVEQKDITKMRHHTYLGIVCLTYLLPRSWAPESTPEAS